MNALQQHIETVKEMDEALYLGRLAWYTVSDMKVSHQQVVQGLHAAGLGTTIPAMPKDHDVFRRVSTDAQVKKVPVVNEPNTFENYIIREIDVTDPVITRRLVVEKVNKNGKRLGYRQIRDIMFNKDTGAIVISTDHPDIVAEINSTADQIISNIRSEYVSWRGMLTAYAVREFVRKLIMSWGATPVRDGVYFLPEDQKENVEAIETFVNNLPGNCNLHSMPLIDDGKQREMVKEAFESDTVGAINKLMGKIQEYRSKEGKISVDTYAAILTEYQTLVAKTEGYKEILETSLGETSSSLLLFDAEVQALLEKVKA